MGSTNSAKLSPILRCPRFVFPRRISEGAAGSGDRRASGHPGGGRMGNSRSPGRKGGLGSGWESDSDSGATRSGRWGLAGGWVRLVQTPRGRHGSGRGHGFVRSGVGSGPGSGGLDRAWVRSAGGLGGSGFVFPGGVSGLGSFRRRRAILINGLLGRNCGETGFVSPGRSGSWMRRSLALLDLPPQEGPESGLGSFGPALGVGLKFVPRGLRGSAWVRSAGWGPVITKRNARHGGSGRVYRRNAPPRRSPDRRRSNPSREPSLA